MGRGRGETVGSFGEGVASHWGRGRWVCFVRERGGEEGGRGGTRTGRPCHRIEKMGARGRGGRSGMESAWEPPLVRAEEQDRDELGSCQGVGVGPFGMGWVTVSASGPGAERRRNVVRGSPVSRGARGDFRRQSGEVSPHFKKAASLPPVGTPAALGGWKRGFRRWGQRRHFGGGRGDSAGGGSGGTLDRRLGHGVFSPTAGAVGYGSRFDE